jgi:hypothetical protein
MFQLIHTKLLLVIAALLATLVGIATYDHHRQVRIEQKRQEFHRPMRADERAAQPSSWADTLKKR